MKKLFLGFFIVSLFFFISLPIVAQENTQPDDYQLPYPGILPDSPLYFLKTTRDKIVSFLISDSLKKAEFDVLQADKRLQAGVKLIEKGKEDLAEETISKGENYFEEAVSKIEEAKREGKDVKPLLETMSASVKKHQEVVGQLQKKAGKKKGQFAQIYKRLVSFEKKVDLLINT